MVVNPTPTAVVDFALSQSSGVTKSCITTLTTSECNGLHEISYTGTTTVTADTSFTPLYHVVTVTAAAAAAGGGVETTIKRALGVAGVFLGLIL
jgi:hypothetical protein